jgi:hypothetical protein
MSTSSRYGSPQDWATILSGVGQGSSAALQGSAGAAQTKSEAKELKRRTLANLMNQAMKRDQGLFKVGQEYNDEMNDFQNQALQQVARGFVDALGGSTRRGR